MHMFMCMYADIMHVACHMTTLFWLSPLARPSGPLGYKIWLLPIQYIMAILDYPSADIFEVSRECVCVCV